MAELSRMCDGLWWTCKLVWLYEQWPVFCMSMLRWHQWAAQGTHVMLGCGQCRAFITAVFYNTRSTTQRCIGLYLLLQSLLSIFIDQGCNTLQLHAYILAASCNCRTWTCFSHKNSAVLNSGCFWRLNTFNRHIQYIICINMLYNILGAVAPTSDGNCFDKDIAWSKDQQYVLQQTMPYSVSTPTSGQPSDAESTVLSQAPFWSQSGGMVWGIALTVYTCINLSVIWLNLTCSKLESTRLWFADHKDES